MAVLADWHMGDHDAGRIPTSGMGDNGVVPFGVFGSGERAGMAIKGEVPGQA